MLKLPCSFGETHKHHMRYYRSSEPSCADHNHIDTSTDTMGHEANAKAEDGGAKRRSNQHKLAIAAMALLIFNGLAFLAFQRTNYSGTERIDKDDSNSEAEIHALRLELERTRQQLEQAQALLTGVEKDAYHRWMLDRRSSLPAELREYVAPRELPFGFNQALRADRITASVGHACVASVEDVARFMRYEVGGVCPDDDGLAQKLLLAGCEPLPRRRCLARGPQRPTEPLPHPESLWTAPDDGNINWSAYDCKSLACLNARAANKTFADCIDCFDLRGREARRWVGRPSSPPTTAYTVDQVIALRQGTLRIGLDIGGGTGSFAVRMRERNVTIITSSLNLDGPFNNFMAHRGVLPLFVSLGQRFPFWDNTLDIVHSMHVLSNWIPAEALEFIVYDIDRVLRPGGILWLDHFFCLRAELESTYAPLIRALGYRELRWDVSLKLDRGPARRELYLSALLQKPLSVRR